MTILENSANAQADNQDGPRYETKVYNIADLLDEPMMLSETGDEQGASTQSVGGGFGGMGGGMGGAGQGAMGGGGMFRIPENILPQFGDGGLGGGGFGGGGFGGGGTMVASTQSGLDAMMLEQLVLDHLADDKTSWMQTEGVGGKISVVGVMMIVTHTSEVHARLFKFLDALRMGRNSSPTVQVDVRIVEVASDQTVSALTVDAKAIETLANDSSAARMSLRCNNHRVAKVSSGLRRSYVVSIRPVVGSNGLADGQRQRESAYQPVTSSLLLGLFGKIKPDIALDQKTGRIHMGIRLASGPEEVVAATFGTGQSIDRVELETAELETSIQTVADRWTLAGSVAVTDPTSTITSGVALSHLAILVRWTAVD